MVISPGTSDATVSEQTIPPRVAWLHQHLPWKQFLIAESFVVAAITVFVAVVAFGTRATIGVYAPPCTTKYCEEALSVARRFSQAGLSPCESLYDQLCGPGVSATSLRLKLEESVSAALKARAATPLGNMGALTKLASFYASCQALFTPAASVSRLQHDVTTILVILQMIDEVNVTLLLGPNSPEEVRRIERLYERVPFSPDAGYYEKRLFHSIGFPYESRLAERHMRCLEDDVGGVSALSPRGVCVSPRGVFPPLFYPGAEPFINFPTLGFLLAMPYADVLYQSLKSAPSGSDASRRFSSILACLKRQIEVLTNFSLDGDQRPAALFRHAGALQLAYDAVKNSGGFRGGDLERRAFFERHCWLSCSRLVQLPRLTSALGSARSVCNIAVRNVLSFYLGFRCYPEDFMGSSEVCAVFGAAQLFEN